MQRPLFCELCNTGKKIVNIGYNYVIKLLVEFIILLSPKLQLVVTKLLTFNTLKI
jgi:hypothetical protein